MPEGKTESWSNDPFLGEIVHDDETDLDYIFGRGAIDDKQVGGNGFSLVVWSAFDKVCLICTSEKNSSGRECALAGIESPEKALGRAEGSL